MLWTIVIILLALWVLGMVAEIGGGFIHLLLLAAGIFLVARILQGRGIAFK